MKIWLLSVLLFAAYIGRAQAENSYSVQDSECIELDTINLQISKIKHVKQKTATEIKRYGNILTRFIRAFDEYDTLFISPNYYYYSFLIQNTTDFEYYKITSGENRKSLAFAPNPSAKIGPYIGWKWIFLGWTFSPKDFTRNKPAKTEVKLSLYSSMLGCDLLYRRTGSDFQIRRMYGFSDESSIHKGSDFSGMRVELTGLNAYYIFNHKRFSYPAAYSQSTVQRISCGSWIAGFSFTRHRVNFDHTALPEQIQNEITLDMKFNQVNFDDYSLSGGYSYNWVPRRNCLINVSLSPALGYKKTRGSVERASAEDLERSERFFSLNRFNFNCIGRIGVVWNNTKFYGGTSVVIYSYNYWKNRFSMSNTFGAINLYLGLNFKRKKEYQNRELIR